MHHMSLALSHAWLFSGAGMRPKGSVSTNLKDGPVLPILSADSGSWGHMTSVRMRKWTEAANGS